MIFKNSPSPNSYSYVQHYVLRCSFIADGRLPQQSPVFRLFLWQRAKCSSVTLGGGQGIIKYNCKKLLPPQKIKNYSDFQISNLSFTFHTALDHHSKVCAQLRKMEAAKRQLHKDPRLDDFHNASFASPHELIQRILREGTVK